LRNHGGQPFIFKPREDFVFDNYTRDFISAAPNRTLAVFNLGAHYHVYQHYKEDLEKFLLVLDELERPQDLYFFRTTVPGHPKCLPRSHLATYFQVSQGFRIVPLANFEDYKVTSDYNWNMMFDFNRHTKQVIENRKNRNRSDSQVATVHILDVVNMTILRQDGHIGGRDCLHYISPGPVDWWNHLMYTTLELAGRPALPESWNSGEVASE
jgi:hypothetical protein